MNLQFNVDTDEVIKFTNKLEKLSKSAFPNAVRGTLNGLAFDVKKTTMPNEAKKAFIERDKRFFKSQSGVHTARGFNLNTMVAVVGFSANQKNISELTIENLEEQEHGGIIKGRKYIPINKARTSKSNNKRIAKKNRLNKIGIKNIVRTSEVGGKSEGHRFNKALHVAGVGGFVQSTLKSGVKMVWRIDGLKKSKRGRFKITPVYIVNDSEMVRIKRGTHFMQKASEKSIKKGNDIYIKEAERQFQRVFK